MNLGTYRIALDDVERARESARQGLRIAREVQDSDCIARALQHLALTAALGGQANGAAWLLGYVNAQYKAHGTRRESTEQWGYGKLITELHEKLSDAEIEKLAAEGAAWEDQAVEEALKA